MTNLGKWDGWYAGIETPEAYGDVTTYALGAMFLDGLQVEDWGCGKGYLRTLVPQDCYRGVDGSQTPFADVIADLADYTSQTDGLFMRHVLEHDYRWARIFDNALQSFSKRMVLILFTPTGEVTREIAYTDQIGVPDISFCLDDLQERLPAGVSWVKDWLATGTQYGEETIIYLERETS